MKIEMGESLLQSYLKHVKNCVITQTNWKTSSNWQISNDARDNIEHIYNKIKKNNEFSDVFKKNELEQILKQAEIDVLGLDSDDTVYMVEVAFHENGLNYGAKIETKNKIFEKLLRAYLIGLAYFSDKKLEIVFATPKTNPSTKEIIMDYFEVLAREFEGENVNFKYITNEDFKNKILMPTLQKTSSDSDTSELFLRTYKLLDMFDFCKPEQKIIYQQIPVQQPNFSEQNLTKPEYVQSAQNFQYNQNSLSNANYSLSSPPKIYFFIQEREVPKYQFNQIFLQTKHAKRIWLFADGRTREEVWNANNFTENSDLMANIKTTATYRKWKQLGIIKVELKI